MACLSVSTVPSYYKAKNNDSGTGSGIWYWNVCRADGGAHAVREA